jgi:hypothetical protein
MDKNKVSNTLNKVAERMLNRREQWIIAGITFRKVADNINEFIKKLKRKPFNP